MENEELENKEVEETEKIEQETLPEVQEKFSFPWPMLIVVGVILILMGVCITVILLNS